MAKVHIEPTVYLGKGMYGDFDWMSKQPEYSRSLFVFNDNEEQFLAYLRGEPVGFTVGGGNAIVRPLRLLSPPRSAGVPTGVDGHGYRELTGQVRGVIDSSLSVIRDLISTGAYDDAYFSRDPSAPTLGSGIFVTSEQVLAYIYESLIGM